MRGFIVTVTLLAIALTACEAQTFKAQQVRKHIKTLADDSFQGRGAGTEGERAAAEYIISNFKKLGLQPMGDNNTYLQAFDFKRGAHGEGEAGVAHNVVGYLDNGAKKTIVIGAHYDHLGTGDQGSSLDANPSGQIHNGADDNASGVAGTIELARYFTENNKKEKNNFLFVCFSGEELGLLGSKYLTEQTSFDASRINFMINMDMIGRLDPQTKSLSVSGTGTSLVWEPVLKKLATKSLDIKTDSSGTGPSDHTSFYLKDIPVLHFFTGSHSDYHKPTDDWDKVNYDGEVAVLNLIARVIDNLDGEPKLEFLKTKSKAMASRTSFKVTLGIMPSYSSNGSGLKVDGVTDDKPAHKAGIKTGDIIIQIGDVIINDIQDYMKALGKFEKGQTVEVKVKRGEETLSFPLTF
jgi:hypothetical protein